MATTTEIVLRFVSTGAFAIGVFAVYGAARMRVKTAQAHKWPTVTGTIVASELETHRDALRQRDRPTYGSGVRYAYEVAGKAYESDQIQLGGSSETSDPTDYERPVAKYPEGKKVKVYYDPTDPGTATIEPGATGGVINMGIVGGGFMLVGAVIFGLTLLGGW